MTVPRLRSSGAPVTGVPADVLVVAVLEGADSAFLTEMDAALDGVVADMMRRREFTGRFAQRVHLRTLGRLPAARLLLLGLGRTTQLDAYRLYNAFQFAGETVRETGATSAAVQLDGEAVAAALGGGTGPVDPARVARAVVTGMLLGNWRGRTDKTGTDDEPEQPGIDTITVGGVHDGPAVDTALVDAAILAEATNTARTWATMPSNTLTPSLLAAAAAQRYEGTGVELEVIEQRRLEELGMGALLGVARGSAEPPVMICARWDGGRPDGPRLGLVGKGITFDTGGISIKPSAGMESMKSDMAGAAAVLSALWAIARLGIPANVVAVVPATENMPGGRAYKPGDVLRSRSGTTIEVLNTDAEGRIVLADGLARAREMGATHLADVATLTGAIVVALGRATTGLMGTDPGLIARVQRAAAVAGDRFTELPLPPEYDDVLDSDVADIANVPGGREAGAIAAGVFLRAFTGGLPWVHMDIAGTSWNRQHDLRGVPSGPSGAPVRTLVEMARAFAES